MASDAQLILPLIGADQQVLNDVTSNVIMSVPSNKTASANFKSNLDKLSELPSHILKALLRKYELDMRLFGYKFDVTSLTTSCAVHTKDGKVCC